MLWRQISKNKMKSHGDVILPHASLEYIGPSTGRNFVQLISGVTTLSSNDLMTLILIGKV